MACARPAVLALAALALLAGACGGDDGGSTPAPGTAAATTTEVVVPTGAAAAATGVADLCDAPEAQAFELVRLTASDGVPLTAAAAGAGPVGIVLAHQRGSSLCGWLPYARELAATARVLVLDLRGNGGSGRARGDAETRYDLDVAAGAALLRAEGATRIVELGASMGATSVLAAARLDPPPDVAISLSAPQRYNAVDAAPTLAAPPTRILLVAAEDDGRYASDAQELGALAVGDPRVTVLVVPQGGHGYELVRPESASRAAVDGAIRAAIAG